MQDQYEAWLKVLERYYSLPVTKEITWKRLTKNTRVYAKWIDPTDPELHGSWMSGTVLGSQTWEGNDNQWHYSYHILFDNGDQDEDIRDGDVLEEDTFNELLREKMEGGRKRSKLSGFEAIVEASKISSPVRAAPIRRNGATAGGGAKKKLYAEDPADDDSIDAELLRCNEVLDTSPPSPTNVARLSSTPSPDVHYGIYMKAKPWNVKQVSFKFVSPNSDETHAPTSDIVTEQPQVADEASSDAKGQMEDKAAAPDEPTSTSGTSAIENQDVDKSADPVSSNEKSALPEASDNTKNVHSLDSENEGNAGKELSGPSPPVEMAAQELPQTSVEGDTLTDTASDIQL